MCTMYATVHKINVVFFVLVLRFIINFILFFCRFLSLWVRWISQNKIYITYFITVGCKIQQMPLILLRRKRIPILPHPLYFQLFWILVILIIIINFLFRCFRRRNNEECHDDIIDYSLFWVRNVDAYRLVHFHVKFQFFSVELNNNSCEKQKDYILHRPSVSKYN